MTEAPSAEPFQAIRPLLFSVAYRMLGSATEAEDVVQDAYVRYATTPPVEVRSLKDYLSKAVSRLCLDRLKSARAKREQYVGPWLPEPVVTTGGEDDPLRGVERKETVTLAFLVLLESLTPQERAVFLMREVFEYEYAEIAEALELSQAHCRQLFHRAKERVQEHRPRFAPDPMRQRLLLEQFLSAAQQGDLQGLLGMLTEDAVFRADGGGKVEAAKKPAHGRMAVAKLFIGLTRLEITAEFTFRVEMVNNTTALLVWRSEELDLVLAFEFDGDYLSEVELIRNPDKLAFIRRQLQEAHNLSAAEGTAE